MSIRPKPKFIVLTFNFFVKTGKANSQIEPSVKQFRKSPLSLEVVRADCLTGCSYEESSFNP